MAVDVSRSSSSADSYLGSLISLTSKSEIRYEGVLYNINTVESSIGLRSVRSFGTEDRKTDGLQVPASERVYDYILFRGSDIKDLQVKASPPPPVQSTPSINNDPAIIQSHYPLPSSSAISLPATVTGSLSDNGSHTAHLGQLGSTYQSNLPLYHPAGSTGSWGPQSLLNANASGIPLPMYWQGYYGLPNAHPSFSQQSLLRPPPPGLSLPPSIQQHQYPGLNGLLPGASALTGSNISDYPNILPGSTNSLDLSSISLPSTHLPSPISAFPTTRPASEMPPSLVPNKRPSPAQPSSSIGANLIPLSPLAGSSLDVNVGSLPSSSKPNLVPSISLPYQSLSPSVPLVSGTSVSNHAETPAPSLITPGQLLQSFPTTVSSAQSVQAGRRDLEVVPVSSSSSIHASVSKSTQLSSSSTSGKQLASVTREAQPPILPLPAPSRPGQKFNGAQYHGRNNYRGRERGRGPMMNPRATTKFVEEFDFTAMNERFNKDEVWGHLGKSRSREEDGDVEDEEEFEHGDDYLLPNAAEMKPMYNRDDFFDTISCNSLDRSSHERRTRFSEQMRIDTETFGDFPRYRGGWGRRGGGRSRGGYYGRGYNDFGRGRGRSRGY